MVKIMTTLENNLAGLHANDLVEPARQLITPEQALLINDSINEGDYISLPNVNNLAEALIYRRNTFKSQDKVVLPWDGESLDNEWYYQNTGKNVFYIKNANELAALDVILASGVDFQGKTIRLVSNINMNGKNWNPLGRTKNSHGVFRGAFDGNGHGIYNITINRDMNDDHMNSDDMAFFDRLEDAIVKSVVFENVQVNTDYPTRGRVAAVAVKAKRTVFSDVNVSGYISGNICAAFVISAIDTAFYNCVNRASIRGMTFVENGKISCGGFVGKLTLSEKVRLSSRGKPVLCFQKCSQCGDITANVTHNLQMFSMGQLYSEFVDEVMPTHIASILIDHCVAVTNRIENLDGKSIDDCSYSAIVNDNGSLCEFNPEGFKRDLIDGLIGRTPAATAITIVRPTSSVVVNNMVIPGSVNTLHTKQHTKSFITTKTDSITNEEGVVNMSPYYDFVTSVGI